MGIGELQLRLSRRATGEEVDVLLYGLNPARGQSLVLLDDQSWGWSELMVQLYKEAVLVLVVKVSRRRQMEPEPGKLVRRIQDALTAIAYLRGRSDVRTIDLVGLGNAGPLSLLVRGLCGDVVRRTYAEDASFRFSSVKDPKDAMFLPGVHRFGDLSGITSAIAPGELFLSGAKDLEIPPLRKAYSNPANLRIEKGSVSSSDLVEWLMRP